MFCNVTTFKENGLGVTPWHRPEWI